MSASDNSAWASSNKAVAMEAPFAARFEMEAIRNKLNFVRATIAVLGFQLVIRALILMRQLNY
jgi:hypothetical protein